jgi:putative flippase GtrA
VQASNLSLSLNKLKMLEKFTSNPTKLFIIDGLGAILSAFLLGYVLVKFENIFGIPSKTLYTLAAMPVFFAFYDLYCIRNKKDDLGHFMKGIAIINLTYCCISILFAFYHLGTITIFGWSYLIIEILIIIILTIIEYKVAIRLIKKANT